MPKFPLEMQPQQVIMSEDPAKSKKNQSVQVLRAFAAFAVVVHHTGLTLIEYYPHPFTQIGQKIVAIGAAGVDLFFVISGYIIYRTAAKGHGTHNGVGRFLLKRALRVYPNYWIWTTILLIGWSVGLMLKAHKFSIDFIVSSYLLLPMIKADGSTLHPLLDQGWTLSFEIYFYIMFSVLIALRLNKRSPLLFGWPFLVVATISAMPNFPRPLRSITTSPLILEFILGACIGWLIAFFHSSIVLKTLIAVCAIAGWMVALFHGQVAGNGIDRLLIYGIPSGFTVIAALLFNLPAKLHRLAWFGDASYSIYLVHGFFTLFLGALLKARHWPNVHPEIVAISVGLVLFLISSLAYKFVESPVTKLLSRVVK